MGRSAFQTDEKTRNKSLKQEISPGKHKGTVMKPTRGRRIAGEE